MRMAIVRFELIALLLSGALLLSTARGDVRLPAIFGDHMVLQRGGPAPVWGEADPGEKITVTAGAVRAEATADPDGRWMARLDGLPVSREPIEVTVEGRNRITLSDVLVGDVWLCSGQSNMEFGIRNARSADEEIARADHPEIRLFFVPKRPLPEAGPDLAASGFAGRWLVCHPATVVQNGWGGFSAAGYFFGRDLQAFTHAPVGLIGSYHGGTPIWAWMSLASLQADPEFKYFANKGADHAQNHLRNDQAYDDVRLPQWREAVEKWKQENPAAWEAYQAAYQQWQEEAKALEAAGRAAPRSPRNPAPSQPFRPSEDPTIPAVLFNGMVAPLIPYGITGVAWYQGEANTGEAMLYAALLRALIGDWRAQWGQGDFPFLIVQLANFTARGVEPAESNWAALRESQARTLAVPRTGLVTTIDLGEAGDIHPKDKADVGLRLALAARTVAYGDIVASSGPVFSSASVEKDKIRLFFDHVGSGLVIGELPEGVPLSEPRLDRSVLRGFSIAGKDGKFAWADAVIMGDQVVVSSAQVPAPKYVRYAWAHNPACNLYNKEGLPAVPFRTDTFPVGEQSLWK